MGLIQDEERKELLARAMRQEQMMVIGGAVFVVALGLVLGFATPTSSDLTSPVGRISNVLGWTYFAAWSVSFYPQVILNYRRKSVVGLSFEYQLFNVIGFACYSTFNLMLCYNSYMKQLYFDRHHENNKVHDADAVFAVHGLALTLVVVYQICVYDRGTQRLAGWSVAAAGILVLAILLDAVLVLTVATGVFNWLDFINFLSYIKLTITFVKYLPQAYMNYRNRSTVGCNIHNFLLDFTGGVLSLAQLLLDSADTHDWSAITGDVAKFGLGIITIFYDIIFFVQHYVLYTNRHDPALLHAQAQSERSERLPFLTDDE
eukprot:m.13865 g.13865  ORF g.13865 m.13865 type:complete len:317 (+) comp6301_c0_seq1:31-981(+)